MSSKTGVRRTHPGAATIARMMRSRPSVALTNEVHGSRIWYTTSQVRTAVKSAAGDTAKLAQILGVSLARAERIASMRRR